LVLGVAADGEGVLRPISAEVDSVNPAGFASGVEAGGTRSEAAGHGRGDSPLQQIAARFGPHRPAYDAGSCALKGVDASGDVVLGDLTVPVHPNEEFALCLG
jgi:hypothetical protein